MASNYLGDRERGDLLKDLFDGISMCAIEGFCSAYSLREQLLVSCRGESTIFLSRRMFLLVSLEYLSLHH